MTKINLLLAEDNDTDALLLIRQLRKEGFEVDHVQVKTRNEMNTALDRGGWDIVISDFSMPGFGGGDALELFKSKDLDIPFILVSGTVGEDIAVSIMKGGANDYLMKTHLHRLGPAVKRELEETAMKRDKKRVETVLTQTEKRFQRLIRDLLDVVWLANIEGTKTYIINSAFTQIYGLELEDARAMPSRWIETVIGEDVPAYKKFITELNPRGINALEYRIRRADGQERWVKDQRYIIPGDGGGESMVGGILSDITGKKLAEQELILAKLAAEESSRMKSALLQNMSH
jgi:PAS domain S-box-containing protein